MKEIHVWRKEKYKNREIHMKKRKKDQKKRRNTSESIEEIWLDSKKKKL